MELWRHQELCDVEIHASGGQEVFHAHRVVLAAASPYFRLRISTPLADQHKHFDLEMPGAVVGALLEYVYTGRATLAEELLCALLSAASFLQIASLLAACELEVTLRLDEHNLFGAFALADSLTLPNLQGAAMELALRRFDAIAASAHFATLPRPALLALVSSDDVHSSEERLHASILLWAATRGEARGEASAEQGRGGGSEHTSSDAAAASETAASAGPRASPSHPLDDDDHDDVLGLLQHVRYPLCSASFLESARAEPPLASPAGQRMLLDMFASAWFSPHRSVVPRRAVMAPDGATFTWYLPAFTTIAETERKKYSPTFRAGGHAWRLLIFPRGNNHPHLAAYLDAADTYADEAAQGTSGWSRHAWFRLTLVNRDPRRNLFLDADHTFCARHADWGWQKVTTLEEIYEPTSGFLVDDTLTLSVLVRPDHKGPAPAAEATRREDGGRAAMAQPLSNTSENAITSQQT